MCTCIVKWYPLAITGVVLCNQCLRADRGMIDAVPDLGVLSSRVFRAAACSSTPMYRALLCGQTNQIKHFNADGDGRCDTLYVHP